MEYKEFIKKTNNVLTFIRDNKLIDGYRESFIIQQEIDLLIKHSGLNWCENCSSQTSITLESGQTLVKHLTGCIYGKTIKPK